MDSNYGDRRSAALRTLGFGQRRRVRWAARILWLIPLAVPGFVPVGMAADTAIKNDALTITIDARDGSYSIAANGTGTTILHTRVAAQIDHRWVTSSEYAQHEVIESSFEGALGSGHQVTVTFNGSPARPTLRYTIRTYDHRPFGDLQVAVVNQTGKPLSVQAIRPAEAVGQPILQLGAKAAFDRVLSDSFSEDWPPLRIFDLGQAPSGMHRAVGSQLVYNRQTKQSVFFGALSSDRFLTILHLKTQPGADGATISGFTIDSTGTTEIQATDPESGLRDGAAENLVELSLPLANGEAMESERVMFAAGNNYFEQLDNYGAAIRELHHSRIAEDNLLGWWSWTAYYTKITEGNTFTNALWLARELKPLGYDWFHFDLGYSYARSEYTTSNATGFPHGVPALIRRVFRLGLKTGVWTAPFEVSGRSWVYEHHKDWLVQNLRGKPIQITSAEEVPNDPLYVLDTTNPGAQEYLRETYRTLAHEWGVQYIKLDFMDNTAIEGRYFRPNTTAIEAQRIGLEIIRKAVGENVLLDKDGSPMLNPVGLVDEGRLSQDAGHLFARSKEAAPGIAARYYMHRNFFISDPDAFTVSRQVMEEREIQAPLTLDEARVAITLAAVSGGMYEIGDDLPTLGADADRVALLKNPDLLQMAKLGRAALPVDLMTYRPEDEQPSVFLLREDAHQSVLAVFNWTEQPRKRRFSLAELKLCGGGNCSFHDVLDSAHLVSTQRDAVEIEQPAHSVRVIKIADNSVPAAAPAITIQLPARAKIGEDVQMVTRVDGGGVPAIGFHWDFGDGTTESGREVRHTYTLPGKFTVKLVAEGVDGIAAEASSTVSVPNETIELPAPSRYQPTE